MKNLFMCFFLMLLSSCFNNQGGNEPYVLEENQVEFYEPVGPYYYYEDGYNRYDDHHDHDHHGGDHDHGGHGH